MLDRQWFILYVVVCLEVGLFLSLVPWSAVWERNYFLQAYPSLGPLLLDPAIRGAVTGLGLANIYLAVSEVVHRRRAVPSRESSLRGGESESGKPSTPESSDADQTGARATGGPAPVAADEHR